jgi:hypothetical protein
MHKSLLCIPLVGFLPLEPKFVDDDLLFELCSASVRPHSPKLAVGRVRFVLFDEELIKDELVKWESIGYGYMPLNRSTTLSTAPRSATDDKEPDSL